MPRSARQGAQAALVAAVVLMALTSDLAKWVAGPWGREYMLAINVCLMASMTLVVAIVAGSGKGIKRRTTERVEQSAGVAGVPLGAAREAEILAACAGPRQQTRWPGAGRVVPGDVLGADLCARGCGNGGRGNSDGVFIVRGIWVGAGLAALLKWVRRWCGLR